MKLLASCSITLAGALLALCGAMAAGAVTIDDPSLTASRSAWATRGSGIAQMVMDSVRVGPMSGEAAVLVLEDIALERIFIAGLVDPVSRAATALPATILTLQTGTVPQYRVPSPELLLAPGTSTISVAGTKTLGPWDIVPNESGHFLQVALAMVAFGFFPATLRRPR